MKKNLMFALVAAACCTMTVPAYSQEASPAPVAPAAASPHVELMMKGVALMDQMATALEKVTDKASADAAASEVASIAQELQALSAEADKLGEPSAEDMAKLQEVGAQVVGTIMRLGMAGEKLMQAECYGSETLVNALKALGEDM